MMSNQHSAWYVVADGKKVRILVREGSALKSHLAFDSAGHGDPDHDPDTAVSHIHAPKQDPHQQAKDHFAHHVAKHLNEAVQGGVKEIELAAPAHVLHEIRAAMDKKALAALTKTLSKDLTNVPDGDLLSHFE